MAGRVNFGSMPEIFLWEEDFGWVGGWGRVESRFQITHFQFGNRYGPCDLSILSRQLEFEIVNMHVDELQTQNASHNDTACLSEQAEIHPWAKGWEKALKTWLM